MGWELVLKFLVLLTIVPVVIILVLHRVFFAGVEDAKQRLNHDAEAARAREADLSRKIKQADEELAQRKRELDAMEQKMKGDLEAEAVKHKEELVTKARQEADDIIVKAQNAAEGIRRDIEKQMELKIVDYASKILGDVLTQKAKASMERDLIEEFVTQLKDVDMTKISSEIKQAELVTVYGLSDDDVQKITDVIKSKTGRTLVLTARADAEHISGVILKFGSLQLDGSIKTAIQDNAITLKTQIEKTYQDK